MYSKDTLPHKPKANKSLVINLEDYFDGDGTHRGAVYNNGVKMWNILIDPGCAIRMVSTGIYKRQKSHRVQFDSATRYK